MARRSRCETINKDVSEKLLSCIMVLVLALYYGTRTGLHGLVLWYSYWLEMVDTCGVL